MSVKIIEEENISLHTQDTEYNDLSHMRNTESKECTRKEHNDEKTLFNIFE